MTDDAPDWNRRYRIDSPERLDVLVRAVVRSLDAGDLEVVPGPDEAGRPATDLRALLDAPTRPDVVEAYLRDARTGQLFRLGVETYRGSGGDWQAVPVGQGWEWLTTVEAMRQPFH